MWQTMFDATNVIALVGWAMLILLPRREGVIYAILYGAIGLLCACYLVMLVALVSNLVDPMPAAGAPPQPDFEYSVIGLMEMFRSQGAIVVGWTHYLAFDMLAGLWIARDADKHGASRLLQVPYLLVTFMAGPAGLFAWLVTRAFLNGNRDGEG